MVAGFVIALALSGAQVGEQRAPLPAEVAVPNPPAPAVAPPPAMPLAEPQDGPLLLPVFDSPNGTTVVGYVGPSAAVVAGPAPAGDAIVAAGDAIVVTARARDVPGDPLQALNAKSYEVTQSVDRALVAPAAKVYKGAVPREFRSGLRHFFQNLQEPIVALNYLLQLKPGKAAETVARFAINSTIGLGGVIDVARTRPFRLPRRSNDFANTLGYYGVGPGAFFFLPLVGPTTVRDLIGGAVDSAYFGVLTGATVVGRTLRRPQVAVPVGVVRALDYRIEFDEHITEVNEGTGDPYTAAREFYLRRRAAEIEALHGRKPIPPTRPLAVPAAAATSDMPQN